MFVSDVVTPPVPLHLRQMEVLSSTLTIIQCAALLDIVHAAIGFVRSHVFVTTLQVGSRIAALIGITQSPAAIPPKRPITLSLGRWIL